MPVRLSLCLSDPYGLQTRKRKSVEKLGANVYQGNSRLIVEPILAHHDKGQVYVMPLWLFGCTANIVAKYVDAGFVLLYIFCTTAKLCISRFFS